MSSASQSASASAPNAEAARWYAARKPAASAVIGNPGGMRIAIQGEPGSFSHEAALKLAPDACIVPCSVSAEVFAALASGAVDAAAIPIENSLAGSVLEHFDLLLSHDVLVERETLLRIRHNLIALAGVALDQVERVFSHPVALAQCKRYLAAHPRMEPFAFYDTAGSVKQLVELGDAHAAAIASRSAAGFYGAQILDAFIEDNPQNYTRFFLVRRAPDAALDPDANKLSLAFSLENRPGSLVRALTQLSALGTNLSKIESRPVHGKPWEYIFYVDCQIASPEEALRAVAALEPLCPMLKVLGRYREAAQ
ncbi:MAG TPA: prephenate dehydratase [Terracidiphilus sp.]|nr:prephenate dehydratase [Terracidiphilus sp.]